MTAAQSMVGWSRWSHGAGLLLLLAAVVSLGHHGNSLAATEGASARAAAAVMSRSTLQRGPFGDAVRTGTLESVEIDEASGLAASRRRSDMLWIHNDSGGRPRLHAVGLDGRDRGAVDVHGASNLDWEDLSSFQMNGVPYLLVADVGDNNAERPSVTLYIVEEPSLRGERFADGTAVQVAWSLEVRFDDGPIDCEGVAVDPSGPRILFVSKRTVPLRLYEVPLHIPAAPARTSLTATRIGEIASIPRPTAIDLEEDPEFGQFRSQATALDVRSDGRALLLFTYANAYRFERMAGERWRTTVSRRPQVIPMPFMVQAEAGAFSRDHESLFVTSEQRPSPLFRLDRVPLNHVAPG